ncbi:tRNA pseudouridine(13) synthase TruD [Saliniradius amylolyticus]|nr:tRNA pseudouridine(13) synthase TruD [Saliniradius amylolyticus]
MQTQHWQYRFGQPEASGTLKQQPADFVVREELGFTPSGEGEHVFVQLEKQGQNTVWVAEQLARFAGVPARAVSYSGRKDKHALTEQWFGIHLPGKTTPDFSGCQIEGVRIVRVLRHHKKLRTGTHKCNRFELWLRDIDRPESVEQRLAWILQGVPNYYGPQRFGRHNSNLKFAELLIKGESIRHRQKRSMAISALRSWLFNEFVSERLVQGQFQKAMQGDIMVLSGSNSFFCAESPDSEEIQTRLVNHDILLSAPLWGAGELATQGDAAEWEQRVAQHYPQVTAALARQNLKQERRALLLLPQHFDWQWQDNHLRLDFRLPTGAFATSVVRELMQTRSVEDA